MSEEEDEYGERSRRERLVCKLLVCILLHFIILRIYDKIRQHWTEEHNLR
jgi:hypothetical protein